MNPIHITPKKYKYGRLIDPEQQRIDARKRAYRIKKERDEFHRLFLGLGAKDKIKLR